MRVESMSKTTSSLRCDAIWLGSQNKTNKDLVHPFKTNLVRAGMRMARCDVEVKHVIVYLSLNGSRGTSVDLLSTVVENGTNESLLFKLTKGTTGERASDLETVDQDWRGDQLVSGHFLEQTIVSVLVKDNGVVGLLLYFALGPLLLLLSSNVGLQIRNRSSEVIVVKEGRLEANKEKEGEGPLTIWKKLDPCSDTVAFTLRPSPDSEISQ